MLLEIDQLTDLHAKEVMYHASSYVQKVHQPQVPGLCCHCQQGECQKSFWSFNDWAQWQLPDMAFKCLTGTSRIEEWITDAYCIMSLLNHIVPYSRVGSRRTLCRRTLTLENPQNLRTAQAGIFRLRTIFFLEYIHTRNNETFTLVMPQAKSVFCFDIASTTKFTPCNVAFSVTTA